MLIPHGLGGVPVEPTIIPDDLLELLEGSRRLRVLVPGRLSLHKGFHLLQEVLSVLTGFAEILLLGSGEFGAPFAEMENVHVVPDYTNAELAARVAEFRPDCALLLSILPETFSYTLSEMQALGVPVVATRLGAFLERIEDGTSGFLVEPCADEIIARLRALAAQPEALAHVRDVLRAKPVRVAAQMVSDYRVLFQQVTVVRPVKAAGRMVTALTEAIEQRQVRERWFRAECERLQRLEAEAAGRNLSLEAERDSLQAALQAAHTEVVRLELHLVEIQTYRDALLDSTSWRLTRPLRAAREIITGKAYRVPCSSASLSQEAPVTPSCGPTAHDEQVPNEKSSPARVIAFRHGDALARRRADWLGSRLGLPVVELTDPMLAGMDLGMGVSLSVGVIVPNSGQEFVPESICLEGPVDVREQLDVVDNRLPEHVVVPSAAIAYSLNEAFGIKLPPAKVTPFPLVGNWTRNHLREAERVRLREALGVPDKTRIIVGIGRADAHSGLLRFARVAMEFAERNNGYCFVWIGGRDSEWLRGHWNEVGVPIALRRLFLIDEEAFELWLLAADAYLGCRHGGVHDAGVLEALAAGLPVAVEFGGSLADDLRSQASTHAFDLAVDEHALSRLLLWTRAPFTPRVAAARLVRERFGSEHAVAEFVAAFTA
nr:glycosyltransferase [Aromatoleum bremense]